MAKNAKNIKPTPTVFAPCVQKLLTNRNDNRIGDYAEAFQINPDPWAVENTQRQALSGELREYFYETINEYGYDLKNLPSWFNLQCFSVFKIRRCGPNVILPTGYEAYYRGTKYFCISPEGHVGIFLLIEHGRKDINNACNLMIDQAWEGNLRREREK